MNVFDCKGGLIYNGIWIDLFNTMQFSYKCVEFVAWQFFNILLDIYKKK